MAGLSKGEKNFEDMCNCLYTIPACDGRTSCHGIVGTMDTRRAVKNNGSVQCKWCIAIDNCWSSRASSPDINTATVSPDIKSDPLMRGSAMHEWISHLSQMMLQKC